jgi:AcrR family transcriptional regulator
VATRGKLRKKKHPRSYVCGREEWLRAAREELVKKGILAVKVDCLARRLRVTRGSFYWHFKSHKDLLEQLLASWVATNTTPFKQVLKSNGNGHAKFRAVVDLWLSEEEYDPTFDAAVREWARISRHVSAVVRTADDDRIEVLRQIFLEMGYSGADALVRARVTYFHQVGYYTLGIHESDAVRQRLRPYYVRVLLGER